MWPTPLVTPLPSARSLIFDNEMDARRAVSRVGGDTSIEAPTPLKTLSRVSMEDANSITDLWKPPPWEPPTFRTLRFGASTGPVSSPPTSPTLPSQPSSPKRGEGDGWELWLEAQRRKRREYDKPWQHNASPRALDAWRHRASPKRRLSPLESARSLALALRDKMRQRAGSGSERMPSSDPAPKAAAAAAAPSPPKASPPTRSKRKSEQAQRQAEEEAKRRAEEEAAAARRKEYVLVVRELSAGDVPDADASSGSDPFAHFTLLNCEQQPMSRTPAEMNTSHPSWTGALQLLLPAASEAALTRQPRLRVRVYDKDFTDGDDLLGETEVTLREPTGRFERLTLHGAPNTSAAHLEQYGDSFPDFTISFAWELSEQVPPAARLKLHGLKAFELPVSPTAARAPRAAASAGSLPLTVRRPFLRFRLLEAAATETFATPAQPAAATVAWAEDIAAALTLPRGSPRPPLVCVELCDADADDELHPDELHPLATADIRLTGSSGRMNATLSGRKGMRDVRVAFGFEIQTPSGEPVADAAPQKDGSPA